MANKQVLKVAICGTGTVGCHAARGVQLRDDLELIGARVYTPEKVGSDVGTLLGGAPLGIKAVGTIGDLIALAPDCVVYSPSAPDPDDIAQLLSAGIDVITTAGGFLFYPFADKPLHEKLEKACQAGGASFHGGGINPGFMSAQLPLIMTSWCRRIERIHVSECAVMVDYPSARILFELMNFGAPLDPQNCERSRIGPRIRAAFEAMVREVADGIGAKLDDIQQSYREIAAPTDLHIAAGVVKQGTVAGQQWRWTGIVEGKPLIQLETNWVLSEELEGWPNKFGWTMTVDGDPGLQMTLNTHGGENSDEECCIATAMQAVNALRSVADAAPGIQTYLDLPPARGHYIKG